MLIRNLKRFTLTCRRRLYLSRTSGRLLLLLYMIAFTALTSCKKDDEGAPAPDIEETGSLSDEIVVDEGSVGLVIDVREIALRGYIPTTVRLELSGAFSDYSAELEVDPDTHIARLEIPASELTEEEISLLNEGVDATITVRGSSSAGRLLEEDLAEHVDNVSVDASNQPLGITTDLPQTFPELIVAEDVPYLLQAIDEDEDLDNRVLKNYIETTGFTGFYQFDVVEEESFEFYFEHVEGGVENLYSIATTIDGEKHYLQQKTDDAGTPYISTSASEPNGSDTFEFMVSQNGDGWATIQSVSRSEDLAVFNFEDFWVLTTTSMSDSAPLSLRLVAANIEWSAEDRGTKYTPPITPPAQLDFAFKSVLKNCSDAVLTEEVGTTDTRSMSYSIGTVEGLELYSGHQAGLSVTAGAEFEANLFGQKATVDLAATASYSYTGSTTSTSSNTWSKDSTRTQEVSRKRTVEVPPHTALEVYDAVQSISNVKVQFVQVIRLRGNYDGDEALTGDEIASQLSANYFGGLITNIADDYVDITTRGVMTVNNLFDAETGINEIADICSN